MMSDEDGDKIVHWLATSKENPSHLSDLSTILPAWLYNRTNWHVGFFDVKVEQKFGFL